jgi:vacuolar-type H+-ATPase subunit E/Vma4
MQDAAFREVIEQVVEKLIDLLDHIDGDPDLEDDETDETETDHDDAPVSLNRKATSAGVA